MSRIFRLNWENIKSRNMKKKSIFGQGFDINFKSKIRFTGNI